MENKQNKKNVGEITYSHESTTWAKKKYPRSRNVEQKNSLVGIVLGLIQSIRRAQLREETSLLPILYAADRRNE